MLNRLFTIVVTLLFIGLSKFAMANECSATAQEDASWLASQPGIPLAASSEQEIFNQKILAYLRSHSCQEAEDASIIDELKSGRILATDGMICALSSGDRVTLKFSHGQVAALLCQQIK